MWNHGAVTDIGRTVLAKAAGGKTLVIDGAQSGTGTVEEYELKTRTSLAGTTHVLGVINYEVKEDGVCFTVQIESPEDGYTAKQIGLFGHVDNEDSSLLAIYQDETGIAIPDNEQMPDFLYLFYAQIQMNNSGSISITLDPSVLVSQRQLQEAIRNTMPSYINDWLDEHVMQETGYVIDNSLTVPGAAADAAAVGTALSRESFAREKLGSSLFDVPIQYGTVNTILNVETGTVSTDTESGYSTYNFSIIGGKQVLFYGRSFTELENTGYAFYDKNGAYISGGEYNFVSSYELVDCPANAYTCTACYKKPQTSDIRANCYIAVVSNIQEVIDYINAVKESTEDELSDLKSAFRQAEYTLSKTPEEALSTETDVDLDVTDADGNVLVRFEGGGVKTKNFDSDKVGEVRTATDVADLNIADADGNVLARLTDGGIETKDFNSGWFNPPLYVGSATNNQVLFDRTMVQPGDVLSYQFMTPESSTGAFIEFLDLDGNRIEYIGRPSYGVENTYSGVYVVPANFGTCRAKNTLTINCICVIEKAYGAVLEGCYGDLSEKVRDLIFGTKNRLANPLYDTFEHYNTEHPSTPIVEESALYPGVTGAAGYRIPSVVVTNAGTILVAGTHMTSAQGDFGEFSIDVARKPDGGSWSITEVVPFDSTRSDYGAVLNNELLVDRNSGRIYLFYGTEKQSVVWWDVATEDGDMRYIYSDNDGETWSNPVSLKSLWDTDVYQYCIPSCTKGITLTDGTLVVPCFAKYKANGIQKSYSLILYKTTTGDWTLSSVASLYGLTTLDECAVVEGTTANEIWLYCRGNTNYGTGVNRGYNKFAYDMENDLWVHKPSTFDTNRHSCFGLDKITISSTPIYLMTFIDSNTSAREKITLWASLDGDLWIRVYRIRKDDGNGYAVIDSYNGKIVTAYEAPAQIKVQDISVLDDLIYGSAVNGIAQNVSVQDRMQMLFNALAGID